MQSYFLGANTRAGFFSLYDSFPPDRDAFLHIIKGGPGTGKSSFMRAIAGAAEERGLEVHRVYCSGDPDSLDGLYLPELRLAWVDGTAPHVREPALFGVDGDYLNLTEFFAQPFTEEEKLQLLHLQTAYREQYRTAYGLLSACSLPGAPYPPEMRSLPRRFLSAVSCLGRVRAPGALDGWKCREQTQEELSAAMEQLRKSGREGILCLSPLDPRQAETLLIPEEKTALLLPLSPSGESAEKLNEAYRTLQKAKELHDRMESLVRPHMDFRGLTSLTAQTIRGLFP